jgi:hypothetical protein
MTDETLSVLTISIERGLRLGSDAVLLQLDAPGLAPWQLRVPAEYVSRPAPEIDSERPTEPATPDLPDYKAVVEPIARAGFGAQAGG